MQNSQCRTTGFDLADTVRLLDLPKSCQAILADCANLAGSTDAYFVCKSHRTIADETGYSRSTVLRAMKEAVARGILSCEEVRAEDGARRPNLYRFTKAFLAFACGLKAMLRASKLKFTSARKKVKGILCKALIRFNFSSVPPCHFDTPPLYQNDTILKNKSKPLRKTKRVSSGVGGKVSTTSRSVFAWIAAAKASASNRREALKREMRQERCETVRREARRYAFLKGRRGSALPEVGKFDGEPTVQTVSEAMERMKLQGYTSEFDRKNWSVPKGFRG